MLHLKIFSPTSQKLSKNTPLSTWTRLVMLHCSMRTELPGKKGPQVKAPHSAFFPVVSGQIRQSAQALSDAQRSFVDLAFRMAVVEAWRARTKKTMTIIVETPEGAVDIAYMNARRRHASYLRYAVPWKDDLRLFSVPWAADAVAMPVHWYYDRAALQRDYGTITGLLGPKKSSPR